MLFWWMGSSVELVLSIEVVSPFLRDKKYPCSPEGLQGNTPVGVDGFEPPTLCL
jgi:hypothetical protein